MTEQLCPACGCVVSPDEGYEKGGIIYCCQPCTEDNTSACECGCCEAVNEPAQTQD